MNGDGWPWPEVRSAGAAGRSGGLPVAFGAEFDSQGTQVLPPEIVQWREAGLAAGILESPDALFAARSVGQPEDPPGVQRLGQGAGDCVGRPGLADCGRRGPVV